ncbi:MAG: CBS domain-containing protein [Acidobacteriota bacterium]
MQPLPERPKKPSRLIPIELKSSGQDVDAIVACPYGIERQRLDDCASCNYYGGLSLGMVGCGFFLRCQYRTGDPAPKAVGRSHRHAPPAMEKSDATLATVMSRDVITVGPEMGLASVSQLMLDHGISGLPVVDAGGRLMGIVAKTDLVRALYPDGDTVRVEDSSDALRQKSSAEQELGPGFFTEPAAQPAVQDAMTPFVHTLPETATVPEAAALMTREGVHRVAIVDPDGRLVGIVSALDVMRWTALKP